jgi:hypothetical protein
MLYLEINFSIAKYYMYPHPEYLRMDKSEAKKHASEYYREGAMD